VILAVGTCLAPDNTKMLSPKFIEAPRQKIIQIDVEPLNMGWSYPIEIGVTSDAKLALREILRILKEQKLDPDAKRRVTELRLAKAEAKFFADDALRSNQVPIAPERLVKEVTDAVGEDDLVVLDAGTTGSGWPTTSSAREPARSSRPEARQGSGTAWPRRSPRRWLGPTAEWSVCAGTAG